MKQQSLVASPKKLPTSSVSEQDLDNSCQNCHNILTGNYCSNCGQSRESSLKYFWSVILHLLEDIFSFDSRASRTLFPLLFKPGFLSTEYFAGRRVHYVPPLRLYLFISIIFFLSLKVFIDTDDKSLFGSLNDNQQISQAIENKISEVNSAMASLDDDKKLQLKQKLDALQMYLNEINQAENSQLQEIAKQVAVLEMKQIALDKLPPELTTAEKIRYQTMKETLIEQRKTKYTKNSIDISIANQEDGSFKLPFLSDQQNLRLAKKVKLLEEKAEELLRSKPEKIFQEALEKLPQIMFVLLPLFALLLKLMYLFSSRLYMEHLTVALHSHSFIFLNLLLVEIFTTLNDTILSDVENLKPLFDVFASLLLVWIPIYLFYMQKRVYGQGYLFTTIKFFSVGILYSCLLASAAVTAFIWGVLSIT